jgi:carbonic anhydrase
VFLIREAKNEADRRIVRGLLEEHAAQRGVNLGIEDCDGEVASLLRACGPPGGCLLLVESNGTTPGCAGLGRLSEDTCEMKWLCVRSTARDGGLERWLALAAIRNARELGYARMRLTTSAPEEVGLYESLGFGEIAPYEDGPARGTRFLELDLAAPRAA